MKRSVLQPKLFVREVTV